MNNKIELSELSDKKFNFKKFLKKNESIIWNNCKKLEIIIESKINKLILKECSNIKLFVSDIISGIELENCENIIIILLPDKNINTIDLHYSSVKFYSSKVQKDNTKIINIKSKIIFKDLD